MFGQNAMWQPHPPTVGQEYNMSLQDITIYRDFPIKNGFVQIPPNEPLDNIRVDGDVATGLVRTVSAITAAQFSSVHAILAKGPVIVTDNRSRAARMAHAIQY